MADRTCSIEGCDNAHRARGWCVKHYDRWMRTGRLDLRTDEERFWSKVDRRGSDECWPWTAAKGRGNDGYGRFRVGDRANGRLYRAPRWLLGHLRGVPLDPDEWALHHCDNPPCVNPAHLYIGPAAKNNQDIAERGRAKGKGQGANHRNKTHCPRGHPYDEANTYYNKKNGGRECRACNRERARARARSSLSPGR